MSKLYPIALQALPGEPAFALYELNEKTPDLREMHRYQIILVNRDDKLAEYRIDMGKANQWVNARFVNIPALWEHSVAELQFIAGQIRDESLDDELDIMDLLDKDGKLTKYF